MATPAASPAAFAHRYTQANGIRIHYVEAGDGDPVVLLHGFPESWYSWRHQIAALSADYRVIAPDLRGYNETEAREPYDIETLQQDVLALIAETAGGRAHVVGHDWGGALAWLVAMNHPSVVRSLAVCNMPHPVIFQRSVRRPRQLLRSFYMLWFQIPWLPEWMLARDNYRWLARMLIRRCPQGTFTRDDMRVMLANWRRQGLSGGINWYRALLRQRPHLPDPPPMIMAPTTLIWGEEDFALGRELTHGTGELVRDFAVHYIPDVGHFVQQEAPDDVNRLLRDHLRLADVRG